MEDKLKKLTRTAVGTNMEEELAKKKSSVVAEKEKKTKQLNQEKMDEKKTFQRDNFVLKKKGKNFLYRFSSIEVQARSPGRTHRWPLSRLRS